jgi:hypothetical protein
MRDEIAFGGALLRLPNCRGLAFLRCQESMSAQTSMACPNVKSPHARRPVGLSRNGITHLIELMNRRKRSLASTGERNDAVRALGNSARSCLPAHPVFIPVGTVAGGAKEMELLGTAINDRC